VHEERMGKGRMENIAEEKEIRGKQRMAVNVISRPIQLFVFSSMKRKR
jgi:hypothetical protein